MAPRPPLPLTSSRVALGAEDGEVTVLATQGPCEPVVG
jgi:hypothetical protein